MLRHLTPQDLAAVIALDRLALGGWWSAGQYQEELHKTNTLLVGLELECHLIAIGAAWLILDEAHIVLLAVHPQYRGQGWGRRTLTYLLAEIPPHIRHATLEVRSQNQIALNLYQSLGFQILGRRPHYYQNPPDDALILWRREPDISLHERTPPIQ
ncbi:MAG: ribosomal protein S18-alanine N-acetyltransferase [Gloeomargarita sp. DG02_3_bins_56]